MFVSWCLRLTNKSPFRNPRTPGRANDGGRTPLSSLANRGNCNEGHGSPKLAPCKRIVPANNCNNPLSSKPSTTYGKTLVQCQLTAKQLNHQEVEEIWKSTTLRQISKILGLANLHSLFDASKIKGKYHIISDNLCKQSA